MPDTSREELEALQKRINQKKQDLADAKARKAALEDRVEELETKLDDLGISDESDLEELRSKAQAKTAEVTEALDTIDSKLAGIESDDKDTAAESVL